MKRGLGWRPDLPDQRDFLYRLDRAVPLPDYVDLRPDMPPVYDQGHLGSCTAQAIGAAFQYLHDPIEDHEDFIPSRLFIYFNERVMEGTVRSDAGATIRNGIKSVAKQGVCPESQWPYITERFDMRPYTKCYQEAKLHISLRYDSVRADLNAMKSVLAEGYPFVFGFTVYKSFDSLEVERTGQVPLPGLDEAMMGGHAVLAVGYDESNRVFIVRNSWGEEWGDGGYCYMPYSYLTSNLTADRWALRLVK